MLGEQIKGWLKKRMLHKMLSNLIGGIPVFFLKFGGALMYLYCDVLLQQSDAFGVYLCLVIKIRIPKNNNSPVVVNFLFLCCRFLFVNLTMHQT